MATKKVDTYTGLTDVTKFITKCELYCKVKGYTDGKEAAFMAERLDDTAFDVYMTLSDEKKVDPKEVKDALKNNFDRATKNREVAVEELTNRKRLPNETPEVFSYKIQELVKLAYPSFADAVRGTLSKDYYVKGLAPNTQRDLRKQSDYETKGLKDLVTATNVLEIAEANTAGPGKQEVIGNVSEVSGLESKLDKLLAALTTSDDHDDDGGGEKINFAGARNYNRNKKTRGRGRGQFYDRRSSTKTMACRNCNSTEHLYRKCPSRYCQSCGKQGHDGWQNVCPNYK